MTNKSNYFVASKSLTYLCFNLNANDIFTNEVGRQAAVHGLCRVGINYDMNRDSDKDIKIWLASGGANAAKPILLQLNCRKITVSFDA